ncbi:DUF2867 domain-containing protein [Streptomyces griseocarneus]|uniref:DUF2867 domain-containing protein n=1 Tax=Streptomyces griseocarneus TaxID=51201 RepID=UPI00167D58DE|nr:DUF2867 domain-containing protein [Streptomyces griseocarneus]MBZ6472346.1 DUF2867 domain-containing protein [Streptomyces griseocarneus]GHG72492.1 hypothetical protein GCM10018779_47890 [Streptomyces griseocarneus]
MTTTTSHVRRAEVPRETRTGKDFSKPHYASAFELPAPGAATSMTPEQWARAVFEGAPPPLRRVLSFGWRRALGLRMAPTSPQCVLGWHVAESGPRSVVLEARSPLMATRNTVLVREASVVWVTLVRFHRPLARPVWAVAAPVHHTVVPWLLKRALARAAA